MRFLKICGISSEADLALVARPGVDLYGLWHRCGGRHDLCAEGLTRLAQTGRERHPAQPCLVTFDADPGRLAQLLKATGIRIVQLHGFCLPAQVRAIAAAVPEGTRLLKVLHLQGARCLEERQIDAYRRSGADGFILDAFGGRHAVGSTGERVCLATARALVRRLAPAPVWLAGGVDPGLIGQLGREAGFAGFDVDSAARRGEGLCPDKIADLVEAHVAGLSPRAGIAAPTGDLVIEAPAAALHGVAPPPAPFAAGGLHAGG